MPDDFTSTVVLQGSQRVGNDDDGMRFVRGALWAMPLGTLLWTLLIFVFLMIWE